MSLSEKALLLKEDFDAVYDAGKRAEVLHWFNAITSYEKREHYRRAFYSTDFTDVVFPKIIKPKTVSETFYDYRGTNLPRPFDLSEIQLPTALGQDVGTFRLFDWSVYLKEIPDMGIPMCKFYNETYAFCRKLETIEIVRVDSDTVFYETFRECNSLKNINFEGEIGKDIDFHYSPLSPDSLKSIVKHLKSYLGTSSEYAYTLTVKTSAWEALEAAGFTDEDLEWIEEVLEIDKDTWLEFEFAWEDTLEVLRWNLVLAS